VFHVRRLEPKLEVWIQGLGQESGYQLKNAIKISLSKDTYADNFPNFPQIWAKLLQYALSSNVEESFNKVMDPDPETDKFQNVISSFPNWCLPVCEAEWRQLLNVGHEQTNEKIDHGSKLGKISPHSQSLIYFPLQVTSSSIKSSYGSPIMFET